MQKGDMVRLSWEGVITEIDKYYIELHTGRVFPRDTNASFEVIKPKRYKIGEIYDDCGVARIVNSIVDGYYVLTKVGHAPVLVPV